MSGVILRTDNEDHDEWNALLFCLVRSPTKGAIITDLQKIKPCSRSI
jgi:hypothetical protein